MSVLVAYASRYGATQQIAERIAATLRANGLDAEARPVKAAGDLAGYDAFVVGSAVYYGSWRKDAAEFVRRNQGILAERPVWLFSSGPVGARTADDQGRGAREAAVPKEIAAFEETLTPREHRVFFGKLDRGALGFLDRLVTGLPAFPGAEGDFRNWTDIESWAQDIARALAPVPATSRRPSASRS
jgi:menaquinone-dependent protoporphyrinogen oxidase